MSARSGDDLGHHASCSPGGGSRATRLSKNSAPRLLIGPEPRTSRRRPSGTIARRQSAGYASAPSADSAIRARLSGRPHRVLGLAPGGR
jgi:hypothetical protein